MRMGRRIVGMGGASALAILALAACIGAEPTE